MQAERKETPTSYSGSLLLRSALDPASVKQDTIDLIVTSPPYSVGMQYSTAGDAMTYGAYLAFSTAWLQNCFLWVKDTGRICINIPLDKHKFGKIVLGQISLSLLSR
ncbi:MAG: DNA methyltransferase [Roseivirga sp.]